MSNDYEGCRLFIAPDGRSGFALQAKGNLAGFVWDFFVSHQENERKAYDLLSLAIEQGGNKLATPDHPLLTNFFERFGFQAVSMLKGNEGNAVTMILLDDAYQKLKPRIHEFLQQMDTRNEVVTSNALKDACASCGQAPQTPLAANGGDGYRADGYQCSRCGFIRIHGCLTLGPPKPA